MENVKLVECPRDAMQGIKEHIPSELKARYLQMLLQCGFHTLDFGSFVSPRAIPQMADTAEVLSKLDLSKTQTKLLAIVANLRGATDACQHPEIDYLGYPFSISENFQMRNTHKTIDESVELLKKIMDVCNDSKKELVVYISMAFGNPYGDPWNVEVVGEWTEKLSDLGVKILSLSDTVGTSDAETIDYLFSNLIPRYPEVEFGAHLHTTKESWHEKMRSAYEAGCRRFDGAIQGFGGCPMAKDELTGNMPTEKILSFLNQQDVAHGIRMGSFESAFNQATQIFSTYH